MTHLDLDAWDPATDLPDAAHLDACASCRLAFDQRFPPVHPALPRGRGLSALQRARPRAPWWPVLALAAAALLSAGLLVPRFGTEPAWERYEAAELRLDGVAAREAARAYLRREPRGEHAQDAENALERLSAVGRPVGPPQVRWLLGRTDVAGHRTWVAVLWEIWCRYCLPALKRLELADLGVPVIALTEATRGAEDAALTQALRGAGVGLPSGVVLGESAAALDTGAWPQAIVIRDGRIAWIGHPDRLSRESFVP